MFNSELLGWFNLLLPSLGSKLLWTSRMFLDLIKTFWYTFTFRPMSKRFCWSPKFGPFQNNFGILKVKDIKNATLKKELPKFSLTSRMVHHVHFNLFHDNLVLTRLTPKVFAPSGSNAAFPVDIGIIILIWQTNSSNMLG